MTDKLTPEQQEKVKAIQAQLPVNWVREYLYICETVLKRRFTRYHAYYILKNCREDHAGWKVIEGIARRHQEQLEKVA